MRAWTGIALARTAPGADGMHSRLSTYLHPLAGRTLAWHTLNALATLQPASERLILLAEPPLNPELFGDTALPLVIPDLEAEGGGDLIDAEAERVLLVDAAAAAIAPALSALLEHPSAAFLEDDTGRVAAAVLPRELATRVVEQGESLAGVVAGADLDRLEPVDDARVVTDRASFAHVALRVRDRIVARLMERGVSFLMPESVLVDVDVRIGRDTVVYPGVVLEGGTTIGEETVIGPGCRIIDSWIGSGVELKGWNFISRSSVRNRAILEPYVRRGFD